MATTSADGETTSDRWQTQGRTTIELRRNDHGKWLATQHGVDLEGRGSSAAAAAAAYCRTVDAQEE